MSDYVKAVNFSVKDTLTSGDPNKKVRGSEIDSEFTAIQTAVATKLDKASPTMQGSPTAPTPSIAENSTVIPTTKWVRDLLNAYEPVGTIKAFAGSATTIPSGWAVCDGTNGTLNLRDRFITGFAPGGAYSQNSTGGHTPGSTGLPVNGSVYPAGSHSHGSWTGGHTLTEAQMPAHTHSIPGYHETNSVGTNPATTGNVSQTTTITTGVTGSGQPHSHAIGGDGSHNHTIDGNVASTPLPGFFALMFIQKIALL